MSSSLQLRIEKLVPGGKGFARTAEGQVALSTHTVPGDLIEVQEAQQRKGYLEVARWRLLEGSPDRVVPPCPVAAQCGGCDWMMLSNVAQDRAKLELLREALARTGKITSLPHEFDLITAPSRLAYRSRVRLQVSSNNKIGFYSAASHDLVEAPQCAVASPEVNRALQQLRTAVQAHPTALRAFAHVEIRSDDTGSVSLHFQRAAGQGEATHAARLLTALRSDFIVSVEGEAPDPKTWQKYSLHHNLELHAPPGTFTQVNWGVNRLLVEQVVNGMLQRGIREFADLYCGSGNFALPLLAQGLTGVGVEANPLAITAAQAAATAQHLPPTSFICSDVDRYILGAVAKNERYQAVLVDPPRAGLKAGVKGIAQLAMQHIVVCSCDPVTLARDLRALIDLGFALEQIVAFDMFPQTHHVETLCWLQRSAKD